MYDSDYSKLHNRNTSNFSGLPVNASYFDDMKTSRDATKNGDDENGILIVTGEGEDKA